MEPDSFPLLKGGKAVKCEQKVALLCKKYNIGYKAQPMRYGYERLEIYVDNYALLNALNEEFLKIRGVSVDSVAFFPGKFTGWLYITDKGDMEKMEKLIKNEMDRVEDWWNRYNAADEDTRRLMACGEIS